jgi:hypothetical protein
MKPIFVENSKIPVWLSAVSPLDEIAAITIFPFVFSRGTIDEATRNHETIHFQQYLETLVVGFLVLYLFDYLKGLKKYDDGGEAYYQIRAEQEAYEYGHELDYLETRKRWEWLKKYEV